MLLLSNTLRNPCQCTFRLCGGFASCSKSRSRFASRSLCRCSRSASRCCSRSMRCCSLSASRLSAAATFSATCSTCTLCHYFSLRNSFYDGYISNDIQGDHSPGKPGKVREFQSGQGKVRENGKSQGK